MNLDVRWLSIFADVPAPSLEESLTFWEQVTGARRGAAAGDEDEFVSLQPRKGDRVLWLQRVERATHVVGRCPGLGQAQARRLRSHGAVVVRDADHWTTLRDPAGLIYCVADRSPGAGQQRQIQLVQKEAGRMTVDCPLCSSQMIVRLRFPLPEHRSVKKTELLSWHCRSDCSISEHQVRAMLLV